MLYEFVNFLLETIGRLGYPGIFLLMALESSLFPFPSEVVIPPAAYLAAKGQMDLGLVILSGIGGSVVGAWFNYWLALKLGRPALVKFLRRYGSYLFLSEAALLKVEEFFGRHGHISTFVGRLIPGVRQYVSLPAGLGRMNALLFTVFTALGAGIWVTVLALCGYFLGKNEALLRQALNRSVLGTLIFAGFCVAVYVWYHRRRRRGS